MENFKSSKVIIILSPQDWSHQFISKHHYALEFSKTNKTVFVSPTVCKLGKFSFKLNEELNPNLFNAQLTLPFPNFFRFKFNKIYRVINRIVLNQYFKKKLVGKSILIIDFGCHKSIDVLNKFQNSKSIYFPVDDFKDLPIESRLSNKIFTVSSNIQAKFEKANIPIKWINHGLPYMFVEKAKQIIFNIDKSKAVEFNKERKKVGYSGNIAIKFLDRESIINTVKSLPQIEFNFFGNFLTEDQDAIKFIKKLKKFDNVFLHGQLSTKKLTRQLFKMDILWLCYKADGKNYHLENSHKILEYLSSGKPFVSTPIKYMKNADKNFIYQAENNKHSEIILKLKLKKESIDLIKKRINFALDSSYKENIKTLTS